MDRLTARSATTDDDAALCQLMRECPMGERMRITLRRDGGYFRGASVQAEEPYVYGVFNDQGQAMGVFSAGLRHVWVDGKTRAVRYLSDLRIHPEARSRRWLMNGYAKVKELLGNGFAQTMILSDNRTVDQLLTSGRAGLPRYTPAGEYLSLIFGSAKYYYNSKYTTRRAVKADWPVMQKFYDEYAASRQFSPVLDLSKVGKSSYFDGLRFDDFCLTLRDGELVAMGAIWDQSAYKQLMVESYSRLTQFSRPVLKWFKGVNLPRQGNVLGTCAFSAAAYKNDEPDAFCELVRYARSQLKADENLMVGLDAREPMITSLRKMRHWEERGRHYLVGSPTGGLPKDDRLFTFDIARV